MEPLDTDGVVKCVIDLKKILESSDIFKRRAFLRTFIDSLEVNDGEITFNYGLPPDGTQKETVSVLGIVPPGPPTKTIPGIIHIHHRLFSEKVFQITLPYCVRYELQ